MNSEHQERSWFAGGVARVMNAMGGSLVLAYDGSVKAFHGLIQAAKRTPELPRKTKDLFARGIEIVKPGEIKDIEGKIKEHESKIKELYYEIGKEGARCADVANSLETEAVQKLIADVRQYEQDIQRFKNRVVEIERQRKQESLKKKGARVEPQPDRAKDEQVVKAVQSVMEKALRHGMFETTSERAIFEKVANDLLDTEMEIKILAAAELGKMGKEVAVPVLLETVGFDDPYLTSEIINSLINIGDSSAIPLFKREVKHPKYRVRIGCLRGLYKLAEDKELLPFLIEALRDEHAEVRRTAATFIGWKDYGEAVPALVQCLRDEDERVRRAAVSAIANIKDESSVLPLIKVLGDKNLEVREKAYDALRVITGEEISFDVHCSGRELSDAIERLRNGWQKERLGKLEMTKAEEPSGVAGQETGIQDPDAVCETHQGAGEAQELATGEEGRGSKDDEAGVQRGEVADGAQGPGEGEAALEQGASLEEPEEETRRPTGRRRR